MLGRVERVLQEGIELRITSGDSGRALALLQWDDWSNRPTEVADALFAVELGDPIEVVVKNINPDAQGRFLASRRDYTIEDASTELLHDADARTLEVQSVSRLIIRGRLDTLPSEMRKVNYFSRHLVSRDATAYRMHSLLRRGDLVWTVPFSIAHRDERGIQQGFERLHERTQINTCHVASAAT